MSLDSKSSYNRNEMDRLVNDIQDGIIKNIHQQLEDADINFTGDLSQSFHKGEDGIFKTVQTDNKYAGFIEFGMPAGTKINYNALRIWVEGKLGISEGDELTQVTWNIYHKIMAHGIQQRRYMRKSILRFIGKHGAKRGRKQDSHVKAWKAHQKTTFGYKAKKLFGKINKLVKTTKRIKRTINNATKPIKTGYKKGKSMYK